MIKCLNLLPSPLAEAIRKSRAANGFTQTQAANLIGAGSLRTWQDWEAGTNVMPVQAWNLWLLATDSHPDFKLLKKGTN